MLFVGRGTQRTPPCARASTDRASATARRSRARPFYATAPILSSLRHSLIPSPDTRSRRRMTSERGAIAADPSSAAIAPQRHLVFSRLRRAFVEIPTATLICPPAPRSTRRCSRLVLVDVCRASFIRLTSNERRGHWMDDYRNGLYAAGSPLRARLSHRLWRPDDMGARDRASLGALDTGAPRPHRACRFPLRDLTRRPDSDSIASASPKKMTSVPIEASDVA